MKGQIDINLIIKCKHCDGKGTVKQHIHDNNTEIIETVSCNMCDGIGFQVKKGHYISFDLYTNRRHLDYLWSILKHEIRIPYRYSSNMTENCKKCWHGQIEHKEEIDGKLIIKREKCGDCNGKGIIQAKTIKDIYNDIFDEYVKFKNERNVLKDVYNKKLWEDEKYNSFLEAYPNRYWEVCIRCKTYFDSIECLNACGACVNESMIPQNGCHFTPIDENAKEWFINKGYKKCIGYSPRYKYWRDI